MRSQWVAGRHGQGAGLHQGEPVTVHVLATNGGVGIGIANAGDTACAKASIMLTGRQAKGFMAAIEKVMKRAGLTQGD